MSIEFNFDAKAFERQMKQTVNDAIRDEASKLERALNSLGRQYRGQSLNVIKPALRRTWKSTTGDGGITEPDLTKFAEAIRDGQRIKFDYKDV